MSLRFLRLALVLALAAPAVQAQSHDHPAAKPALDAELTEHFKGITLTDAQAKQVMEIKAKHHKAMDEIKKNAADANAPAVKAELQKHMDAEHAEFMALLTADQKKVFMENMKAHHKAESEKPKPAMEHGAGHGDHGKAPVRNP